MINRLLPALALAMLLLAGCRGENTTHPTPDSTAGGPAPLEQATCGSTSPLYLAGDIYLAGQPSAEDFKLFQARGVKSVLNLRHNFETPDLEEDKLVTELGMAYYHIPWSGKDQLTNAKLDHMRQVLKTAERPVLFHCASANRVGAGWLAYRVLDDNVAIQDALAEAKKIGLRNQQYEEKAVEYVERLQRAAKINAERAATKPD